MRTLIIILLFMFMAIEIIAFGDKVMPMGSVNSADEVTAPWERSTQAAILGDRVLADFLSSKINSFIINSSCSDESIEKLTAIRKFAAGILSTLNKISSQQEMHAAAYLLLKMDTVSMRPLDSGEKKLLESVQETAFEAGLFFSRFFTCGKPVHQFTACTAGMAVNFSRQIKLKSAETHKLKFRHPVRKASCRNCFYDISFIDLYRMFLYLKDSSGNGVEGALIYNHCSNPSFCSSFNSNPHKTILNSTIHNTGAFL